MGTSRCKGSRVCASHCSAVGEQREQGVLFLSCERVAEVQRGTQSCLNVQRSHAPESTRLWPRAPHTPRTQMLDVSSVFKKNVHSRVCTHARFGAPGAWSCYWWALSHIRHIVTRPAAAWELMGGRGEQYFCLFTLSCPKNTGIKSRALKQPQIVLIML